MPEADLPTTIRAFLSIELPEDLLAALRAVQGRLQSALPSGAVRWAPPQQVHLTLKFLGDVSTAALSDLQGAVATVCLQSAPLRLHAEGLGCFPNPARPRIIWLGIGGELAQLQALQSQLDSATQPWCARTEARPFQPHLTIGRVRDTGPRQARQVGARVKETSIHRLGEWKVDHIDLMRSELSPQGAEHSLLATLPLGAARASA